MGTKLEELRHGCFARAMDDEPMFVLLARDPSAPRLVRQWAMEREADVKAGKRPATDLAVVEEAHGCADRMEAWRAQNDGAWRSGLFGSLGAEGINPTQRTMLNARLRAEFNEDDGA